MSNPVLELCVGMSSFYAFPLFFLLYVTLSHFSPPLFSDLLPNTPSLSLLYLPASSSPPSSLSSCHSVFWLYYYPSLYSHDTQWLLYSDACERRTVRGSEWRILVLINWSPPHVEAQCLMSQIGHLSSPLLSVSALKDPIKPVRLICYFENFSWISRIWV